MGRGPRLARGRLDAGRHRGPAAAERGAQRLEASAAVAGLGAAAAGDAAGRCGARRCQLRRHGAGGVLDLEMVIDGVKGLQKGHWKPRQDTDLGIIAYIITFYKKNII